MKTQLKEPIAIALSGSGRTLDNFLKCEDSSHYKIVGVISSAIDCRGVTIARDHGVPLYCGIFSQPNAKENEHQIYRFLEEIGARWVALAGFLKIFPVRSSWEGRIVNIHPALLPKFGGKGMYGMKVHAAVINAGEKESGATVHFVNSQYDEGRIIAQAALPVLISDSPDTLAHRVFEAECRLYPDVVNKLIRGDLPLKSGKVARYEYT